MDRIGQELSLLSHTLNILWLLVPPVFLICLSRSLYLRKGWRGLAAPAAALFSGFAVVIDYLLLHVVEITGQYLGSGTGHVIYILGSNILNIFPYALFCSLLFSYDRDVLEECRRLRGLENPNTLTGHHGRRGIILAMLSFVLPCSILTSPLGLLRSHCKLHGISKGTIEPRGKGMVVLALGIYAAAIVAASIILGLIIAVLQFAQLESHSYFDLLYQNTLLHLPLHVVLKMPWLTVGFPFGVVMIGGFVAQRRYGVGRTLLGCTGVLLLAIASSPFEDNGVIASATLEVWAVLTLATALWIPQQIEVVTTDAVAE